MPRNVLSSDGRNYTKTEAWNITPLVFVPNGDSFACKAQSRVLAHFPSNSPHPPQKNTLTSELNMLLAGPRVSHPLNISNCNPISMKNSKNILIAVRF